MDHRTDLQMTFRCSCTTSATAATGPDTGRVTAPSLNETATAIATGQGHAPGRSRGDKTVAAVISADHAVSLTAAVQAAAAVQSESVAMCGHTRGAAVTSGIEAGARATTGTSAIIHSRRRIAPRKRVAAATTSRVVLVANRRVKVQCRRKNGVGTSRTM